MTEWDNKKEQTSSWFLTLRNQICKEFEKLETELSETTKASTPAGQFEQTPWQREESEEPNHSGSVLKGGGEISLMRGRVFEKVGVNISTVHGTFSEEFSKKNPGRQGKQGRVLGLWNLSCCSYAVSSRPRRPYEHTDDCDIKRLVWRWR